MSGSRPVAGYMFADRGFVPLERMTRDDLVEALTDAVNELARARNTPRVFAPVPEQPP